MKLLYTSDLHGNRLLFSIWNRWFGDGAFGLDLPEGTLVRNEKNGAIAVIQGGKFRPIANRSVLASRFRNRDILDLNEYDFAMLEQSRGGRTVRLPDLSVVRAEDGATYLLIGDERRHIVSPQAFAAVGFNPEEVEEVTTADLADYRLGRNITEYDARPDRRVARDRQDGSYWLLEAGVRHAIVHPSLLTLALSGLPVQTLPHEEIAAAADGEPIKLLDGELAKAAGDPKVYVISAGQKRPIASEDDFIAFGYSWKKIVTVPAVVLALHSDGPTLTAGR